MKSPTEIEELVRSCDLEQIKKHVKTYRQVTRPDCDGENLLINALRPDEFCDSTEVIKYLLSLCKERRIDHRKEIVNTPNKDGQMPLWLVSCEKITGNRAWETTKLKLIELLVENGAEINVVSTGNSSALYIASQVHNTNIVKYLLDKGANPDIEADNYYTPLNIAARYGFADTVKILIDGGANVNFGSFTPIFMASKGGNLDSVKYLINGGANINLKNSDGNTALTIAAYHGYAYILDYLLKKGAQIDIVNHESRTALMIAVNHHHVKCVARLLQRQNISIELEDSHGQTALGSAFENLIYSYVNEYTDVELNKIFEIFCIFIKYHTNTEIDSSSTSEQFNNIINELCNNPDYKSSKDSLITYIRDKHPDIDLQLLCETEVSAVAEEVDIPEAIVNEPTDKGQNASSLLSPEQASLAEDFDESTSSEIPVVKGKPIIDVNRGENISNEYYVDENGRIIDLVNMTGRERPEDRISKPAHMLGGKKRKNKITRKNKRNKNKKNTRNNR